MKIKLGVLCGLVLLVVLTSGCSQYQNETNDDTISVVVTSFEECIAAGNPAMESFPRQCVHNGEWFSEEVEDLNGDVVMCPAIYLPVCAEVACDTDACETKQFVFSNSCVAINAGAQILYEGYCEQTQSSLEVACLDSNGTWLPEQNECENIDEASCSQLGGTYNGCASACRHDDPQGPCTRECVFVCSFGGLENE